MKLDTSNLNMDVTQIGSMGMESREITELSIEQFAAATEYANQLITREEHGTLANMLSAFYMLYPNTSEVLSDSITIARLATIPAIIKTINSITRPDPDMVMLLATLNRVTGDSGTFRMSGAWHDEMLAQVQNRANVSSEMAWESVCELLLGLRFAYPSSPFGVTNITERQRNQVHHLADDMFLMKTDSTTMYSIVYVCQTEIREMGLHTSLLEYLHARFQDNLAKERWDIVIPTLLCIKILESDAADLDDNGHLLLSNVDSSASEPPLLNQIEFTGN